jgi:N-acetylglucosamine-6-sulfatase
MLNNLKNIYQRSASNPNPILNIKRLGIDFVIANLAVLVVLAVAGSATNPTVVDARKSPPQRRPEVSGPSISPHTLPNNRPNIVFMVADDQASQDEQLMEFMPNAKDIFADHGIKFSDFHSESPLCCVARSGFFTGQHTHNHGVDQNNAALLNPAMTIATQLQTQGYYTMLAGKYLNAYGNNKTCFKKNPANCAPTIPVGWNAWDAFSDPNYYNYTRWHGVNPNNGTSGSSTAQNYGDASDPNNYSTRQVANWAVDQIASAPASQPIFQWVAAYGPHAPTTPDPVDTGATCNITKWFPPNYNEADVSDKPAYVRAIPPMTGSKATGLNRLASCQALQSVDRAVGRIRDELSSTGRLNNTIFIYMGDNGMNGGEHRLSDKQAPYETQIPFYMSWPAMWSNSPYTVNEHVQNIDVAPTLCAITGCTMGPYPNGQQTPDGLSFLNILEGSAQTINRDAVLDEMPAIKSVGTDFAIPTWEAITTTSSSPLANQGCDTDTAAAGGCRWHYIEYATGEKELYDMSHGPCYSWTVGSAGDPCELNNLAGNSAYASIQSQMATRLAQLKASKGQPQ